MPLCGSFARRQTGFGRRRAPLWGSWSAVPHRFWFLLRRVVWLDAFVWSPFSLRCGGLRGYGERGTASGGQGDAVPLDPLPKDFALWTPAPLTREINDSSYSSKTTARERHGDSQGAQSLGWGLGQSPSAFPSHSSHKKAADFHPPLFSVSSYPITLITTPEPTVRPPSRIAKRSPSSHAIGVISVISMSMLSPGMTISTPSGILMLPVTSVVRK